MCQCGNHYCDLIAVDSEWANMRHDELMEDAAVAKAYPNPVERDYYAEGIVRSELRTRQAEKESTPTVSPEKE